MAKFTYNAEFKENGDFDVNDLTDVEKDLVEEEYPQLPEHTIKTKIYYSPKDDWKFSLTNNYATAFYVKYGTVEPTNQYDMQRFDLINEGGHPTLIGAKLYNH